MENNIFNLSNTIITNLDLAKMLDGEKDSAFLQKVFYWTQKNEKDNRKTNFKQGFWWTHNTYDEWQEEFPFWSISTIKRVVTRLKKLGVLIVEKVKKKQYNQTNWYRINFDFFNNKNDLNKEVKMSQSIESKRTDREGQNEPIYNKVKMSQSNTNTTNTNINTIYNKKNKKSNFESIIENYTANEQLRNKIINFIKLRKTLKCPMIDESLILLLKKLDGLANDDANKIEILDYSLVNSYRDIYAPNIKKETKTNSNSKQFNNSKELKFNNFEQRNYDYDKLEKELLESSMEHHFGVPQEKQEIKNDVETQENIEEQNINETDYNATEFSVNEYFCKYGYNYKFSKKDVIMIAKALRNKFSKLHIGFLKQVKGMLSNKNDGNLAYSIVTCINNCEC